MRPVRIMIVIAAVVAVTAAVAADIPISRVVMFSSGVGYFERAGSVEGTQPVSLSFKTDQINDLLKSLVLQDFDGGKIAPVVYAPQDPLVRTLKSFSVDLSQDKSLADMMRALRGAKVAIVADQVLTGTVVGVEKQQQSAKEGAVEFEVVNLLTEKGLQQVPIWHIKSLKLLDAKLSGDLAKALGVLADSHDSGKRPLTITFTGTGKRHVRIGYLLETPVWKTSYRLVNDPKGALLQAWAIVENTTDDDWQGVKLSLVSGRPISFIQDLYQPLYVTRPTVAPSVIGSPPPQTYEGDMASNLAPVPAPAPAAMPASPAAEAPGAMGGMGGGGGVALYARRAEKAPAREDEGVDAQAMHGSGVNAMAAGEKVGELFQYAIDQPVTVARQRSAMIPIINGDIKAEKVSVYNAGVNAKFPLNGMKLKNTTALHLMGGPITVFDGGAYAGDALINDVAPGDERLLTYAVDIGVEVSPKAGDGTQELTSMKVSRGVLIRTHKQRTEMTYTAKNVTGEKRTLLIEHPLRDGWGLVAPAKADETTRGVYRFKVEIAPKSTAKLVVVEEHPETETVALTESGLDDIALYVQAPKISDALKAALQKIIDMKTKLADLAQQRGVKEARIKEINDEQDRLRKNMAQLDRQSDLYKKYVEKLTAQETEFEKLQGEIKALKASEKGQQDELSAYILGLSVE